MPCGAPRRRPRPARRPDSWRFPPARARGPGSASTSGSPLPVPDHSPRRSGGRIPVPSRPACPPPYTRGHPYQGTRTKAPANGTILIPNLRLGRCPPLLSDDRELLSERARPIAVAVRDHHRLPLHLRSVDDRPGTPRGRHADRLGPHRRRTLATDDEVLRQAVPDQLCHGRGDRHRAGVPVRHELERVLPLRRRRLRRPARPRGPDRFLPGVDVPRPVDLRLGPALETGPPGHDLAGGDRHQPVRLLHHRGELVHAAPGRRRLQPRDQTRRTRQPRHRPHQLDDARGLPAHRDRGLRDRRYLRRRPRRLVGSACRQGRQHRGGRRLPSGPAARPHRPAGGRDRRSDHR